MGVYILVCPWSKILKFGPTPILQDRWSRWFSGWTLTLYTCFMVCLYLFDIKWRLVNDTVPNSLRQYRLTRPYCQRVCWFIQYSKSRDNWINIMLTPQDFFVIIFSYNLSLICLWYFIFSDKVTMYFQLFLEISPSTYMPAEWGWSRTVVILVDSLVISNLDMRFIL